MKGIVLFYSTNHAIWAEKILKEKRIECLMITIPRHLSSDCGYCLEFENAAEDEVAAILANKGIEYDRIVRNG